MEIEFNNILTISKKACWWVLFKDHSAHLPAKNAFLYDLVSKTLYNCFLKDFFYCFLSFLSALFYVSTSLCSSCASSAINSPDQ